MLEFLVPQVDAIIVQDQSEIPGTGCIDEEVRKKTDCVAESYSRRNYSSRFEKLARGLFRFSVEAQPW